MGNRKTDLRHKYMTEQVLPTIKKHGWMVQGVFGTPSDPGPHFAYTVGLTGRGLPELVISGLPPQTAARILNAAGHIHTATEIREGDQVDHASSVVLRAVSAPATEGGTAFAVYGRRVRFVQLVWPDKDGNYPGDPGWSYSVDAQPLYTAPQPPASKRSNDTFDPQPGDVWHGEAGA